MTTLRFLPTVFGLAAAAALVAPPGSRAFTLGGFTLGLDQRDVRVFDNFADASANDNVIPEPSFPGYLGAELACWKALVEWGSGLHGDGSGDPSQPFDLGSGGANFDVTWQGLADGIGGLNDNVISATLLLGHGILSVVESPGSDGWRIRLADDVVWSDGPGVPAPGQLDLQGIVTREYGIALGLGHSSVNGATMYSALSGDGYAARSIEADDRAGVQAAYGTQSAAKPRITGIALGPGDLLTISGSGFSPSGNEVWFTRAGVSTTGEPVKALGLASDGSTLVVVAPIEAGPGDVLVKIPGSGAASLSNAWPAAILPPAPAVVGVDPAAIPALTADALVPVLLDGEHFTSATTVSVDGVPLAPGAAWTIQDDAQILIYMPKVGQLGMVDIAVAGPGGSDSIGILIEICDPPVLDTVPSSPAALLNGNPLVFTAASEPGDLVFVLAADNDLPSIVPGFISVGLGNGLSDLFVVAQGVVPAKGWLEWSFTVNGVPPGFEFFSAVAAFPGEGADLLETSDPVQHTVVAF